MFSPSVISSSQSFAKMGMRKFLVQVIHCPQSDSSEEFTLLSEEVDLSRLIPLKLSRLRGEEMKQSLDRLLLLSDQLRESAATLQQRKSKLSKVRFLFEARQVKLLSDLQSIYPI
jgi:hypothetical protein